MGPIGVPEMIFIFVLALLIFGPKKLPELGRSFGKGLAEFRRASNELKSTFQREMDNIEAETREVKQTASEVSQDVKTSYYDDTGDDYYSDYGSSSKSKSTDSSTDTESSTSPTGAESPKTETVNGTATPSDTHNGVTTETSESKSGAST
jgi:sec-independent protein translocase protein TatA